MMTLIKSLNDFQINNTKKLTNQEKDTCDQDITQNEILTSLKQLQNDKTPGTDGLPSDFYKYFWIDIISLLLESILHSISVGELSIEQKKVIIMLLPKKDKSHHLLKN